MFRCGSAGFRIYTVLYVLIPHAFAPIHSFRGSATNVNLSPRARRPREFQQILHWIWGCGCLDWGKQGQQRCERLRRKGFNFEVVVRLQNRVVAVRVGSLAAESAVRFRCAHDSYAI